MKMFKSSKPLTCYATGKTEGLQFYCFGSRDHVRLALSQDAFAHFIIRAGKDDVHQEIMRDLREINDKLNDFSARAANSMISMFDNATASKLTKLHSEGTTTESLDIDGEFTYDAYIEASMERAILLDKMQNLLTQKAESSVRILRQIKKDYETMGKLTS